MFTIIHKGFLEKRNDNLRKFKTNICKSSVSKIWYINPFATNFSFHGQIFKWLKSWNYKRKLTKKNGLAFSRKGVPRTHATFKIVLFVTLVSSSSSSFQSFKQIHHRCCMVLNMPLKNMSSLQFRLIILLIILLLWTPMVLPVTGTMNLCIRMALSLYSNWCNKGLSFLKSAFIWRSKLLHRI